VAASFESKAEDLLQRKQSPEQDLSLCVSFWLCDESGSVQKACFAATA
jgi:hypothetical protein